VESRKRSVTAEVALIPSVTPTKSGGPSLGNCSLGRPSSAPRSRKQITKGRIQFLALCVCLFLAGWNDGSTGPLLLRIQDAYHVWFYDNCSIANWAYSEYGSGKFYCCLPYVRVRVCSKHLVYCSISFNSTGPVTRDRVVEILISATFGIHRDISFFFDRKPERTPVNSRNGLVPIRTKILNFRKSAGSQSGQKLAKS